MRTLPDTSTTVPTEVMGLPVFAAVRVPTGRGEHQDQWLVILKDADGSESGVTNSYVVQHAGINEENKVIAYQGNYGCTWESALAHFVERARLYGTDLAPKLPKPVVEIIAENDTANGWITTTVFVNGEPADGGDFPDSFHQTEAADVRVMVIDPEDSDTTPWTRPLLEQAARFTDAGRNFIETCVQKYKDQFGKD